MSVHGSSLFIQSHTTNMQFLSLPKVFPWGMPLVRVCTAFVIGIDKAMVHENMKILQPPAGAVLRGYRHCLSLYVQNGKLLYHTLWIPITKAVQLRTSWYIPQGYVHKTCGTYVKRMYMSMHCMYIYIQCMYMVSPVVSAGFQKMVNLYRSVYIVSIYILIFMNHVRSNILHQEHVCMSIVLYCYIHTCVYSGWFRLNNVHTCRYMVHPGSSSLIPWTCNSFLCPKYFLEECHLWLWSCTDVSVLFPYIY